MSTHNRGPETPAGSEKPQTNCSCIHDLGVANPAKLTDIPIAGGREPLP